MADLGASQNGVSEPCGQGGSADPQGSEQNIPARSQGAPNQGPTSVNGTGTNDGRSGNNLDQSHLGADVAQNAVK